MAARNLIGILVGVAVGASTVIGASQAPPGLPDETVGARLLEAEDRKAPALAQPLVADPRLEVRARLALTLGRIGLPEGLPTLVQLLGDSAPEVRRQAAFALGALDYRLAGLEAEARARVRQRLVERLGDTAEVAAAAAWSLGQLGGAQEALREALARVDPDAQELASLTLDAWGRTAGSTVEPLARFVDAPGTRVRRTVAHALRRLDDPAGLPILEGLLDDSDPEVRATAIRGLSRAPRRIVEERGPRLLGDPDRRVQCAAAQWLAAAWSAPPGDPPGDDAFAAVLRRSLDRSAMVRGCALAALGAVVRTRAVAIDRLLEALGDPEPAIRATALEALVGADDEVVRRAWARFTAGRGVEALLEPPLGWHLLLEVAVRAGAEDGASLGRRALEGASSDERDAALARLAVVDPAAAGRVSRALFDRSEPEARATALRTFAALEREGELVPDPELIDRAWRAYWDPRHDPHALAQRSAALLLLQQVAPSLLEDRVALLAEEPARPLRVGALTALPTEVHSSRLTPATLAAEPRYDDYGALAADVLAMQGAPPRLVLDTPRGQIVLELRADWAPLTAHRFLLLAREGLLETNRFHRVIPGFVAQTGALETFLPTLPSEDSLLPQEAGGVGLALAGRDSGTSQFYILRAERPDLLGRYPLFARVVEGQRVVDRLMPGDAVSVRPLP